MKTPIDKKNLGREVHANLGAYYATALFDRHGVDQDRRVMLLSDIIGLSQSGAYRRNSGESPWPLEDLKALAEAFGETLGQMFGSLEGDNGERGFLAIDGVKKPCKVWLGPELAEPTVKDFVAKRVGVALHVTLGGEPSAGSYGGSYSVKRLVLEATHSVAVLDDEPHLAKGLSEFLRKQGFNADAYTSIPSLLDRYKQFAYDAYILDWLIADVPVVEVVKTIRAHDKSCFIAILTGKINTGQADADDVAEACEAYNMQPFIKPVPPRLISSAIALNLGR